MSGKKKQKKKKQATSRRTAKQTAQKPTKQSSSSKQEPKQSSRASSKQEPKQTSRASSKPNTPKTSNNQTSKANNKASSKQESKQETKQTTKQEAKQEKQSDKDKTEQVEEQKNIEGISVLIKDHHDSNAGHPHVIVEDFEGDKHVSVGLTTQKLKGKNATNYKLEKDPLGEVEESYMRRQGTVDLQKNYSNSRKGKLTKKDYERALLYGQRAKEKYIKKRQEKKKT